MQIITWQKQSERYPHVPFCALELQAFDEGNSSNAMIYIIIGLILHIRCRQRNPRIQIRAFEQLFALHDVHRSTRQLCTQLTPFTAILLACLGVSISLRALHYQ